MRYQLRTLLILLAAGPMALAGGYWTWDAFRPNPSPWLIDVKYVPPPNTPGYRWKLTQQGLVEVPDDLSPSDD